MLSLDESLCGILPTNDVKYLPCYGIYINRENNAVS
jgi:hypothetical protein